MTMFRWNALDDADAHRTAAMDRTNRGHSSGKHGAKVYTTTRAMDEARGGTLEGSQFAYVVYSRWEIDRERILYALHVDLFGDEFEGVEL